MTQCPLSKLSPTSPIRSSLTTPLFLKLLTIFYLDFCAYSSLLCLAVDLIFPARYLLGSPPRANSSFPSATPFSRVPLSLSLHLLCLTSLHYCRELYDYQPKYFVFLSLSFNFYKAEIITASLTAVIRWYHTCQST